MAFPKPFRSKEQGFLFVNKDATNIGSRSREEISSVKSHIRTLRIDSRGAKIKVVDQPPQTTSDPRNIRGPGNARSTAAFRPKPRIPSVEAKADSPKSIDSEASSSTKAVSSPETPDTIYEDEEDVEDFFVPSSSDERDYYEVEDLTSDRNSLVPVSSPLLITNNGNTDPFSSTSVPLRSEHLELLKIWQAQFFMCIWPDQVSRQSMMIAHQKWNDEMRDALTDEMRLDGVFATASMYKYLCLPPSAHRNKVLAETYEHQSQALTGIRKRVVGIGEIYHIIMAIWHVSSVSFYARDKAACDAHWRAIKTLVDGIGGFRLLPWTSQRVLLQGDMFNAQLGLKPPLFDVEDWDPGDWYSQPWSAMYDITYAERKYFHRPWAERHPKPVEPLPSQALGALIELLAARCLADELSQQRVGAGDKIHEWLHIRRVALIAPCLHNIHRLRLISAMELSTVPLELSLEQVTMNALEYAMYCVISLTSRLLFMRNPKSLALQIMIWTPVHHLRIVLEKTMGLMVRRGYMSHLEHLLWMFSMGAYVESWQPQLTGQQRWHTAHFIAAAKRLGVGRWDDARYFLRKFVYREDVCDEFLQSVMSRSNELVEFMPAWPA